MSQPVPPPRPQRGFSLTPRNLLIVLAAGGAGVAAHLLLCSAAVPFGQAVIAGCAAFGAVFHFLDKYITDDDEER